MMEIRIEKLSLKVPESFRRLSEKEAEQMGMREKGDGVSVLYDQENHLLLSIGYKRVNPLALLLLSEEEIARKDEKILAKATKEMSYRLQGFFGSSEGHRNNGFAYVYKTKNIEMYGRYYVLKQKNEVYYLHFYGRKEKIKEVSAFADETLKSVTMVKEVSV